MLILRVNAFGAEGARWTTTIQLNGAEIMTPSEIQVELVLPSGQALGPSIVPSSHTAQLIITEMAEVFQLPRTQGDKRIEYELLWEQQGRAIPLSQTLHDAGVQENDRLALRVKSSSDIEIEPVEDPGNTNEFPVKLDPNETEIPVVIQFMVDNYSHDSSREVLRLDDTVESVIAQLVKRLDLPKTRDRGRGSSTIVYVLSSKDSGRVLEPTKTLRQHKIPRHGGLILAAELDAGGCAGQFRA